MDTNSSEWLRGRCIGVDILIRGRMCRLVNPYVQPVLYVRRPGSDLEEMHRFPDDDPFFSEVRETCVDFGNCLTVDRPADFRPD